MPSFLNKLRFHPRSALIGGGGGGFDPEAGAWLAGLQARRPAEAARLIEERLNMLRAARLPEVQFVPALTTIQDALSDLQTRAEAALSNAEIAGCEDETELVSTILALLKRTSTYYVQASERLASGWFRSSRAPIFDIAVRQGMATVMQRIELAHRIYARGSAGSWRQLERLARLALAARGSGSERIRAEVEQTHARALLFELADPNRLDAASNEQLRFYLRRHGALARIRPLAELPVGERDKAGLHALNVGRRCADPLGGMAPEKLPADTLLLDARPLLGRLERQLTGLAAGVDSARLGLPREARLPRYQELLRGLGQRWSGRGTRRHGRNRFLPRARLVVGLEHCLDYLSEPARGAAGEGVSVWSILDESATGFGLGQLTSGPHGMRIGEPCCVLADGREGPLLGVVRRAENRGPRSFLVGVELLGSGPRAASLVDPLSSEPRTTTVRAIQLGRLPAHHGSEGLLARTGHLRPDESILLESADRIELRRVDAVIALGPGVELALLAAVRVAPV